jgi:hypothetical protein
VKFELANTCVETIRDENTGYGLEHEFFIHTKIRVSHKEATLLERIPGVSLIERKCPYTLRVWKGFLFDKTEVATLIRAAIEKRRRK